MSSIKMSLPDIVLAKELVHEIAYVSSAAFNHATDNGIKYGDKKKLLSDFAQNNNIEKGTLANILVATEKSPRLSRDIFDLICREFKKYSSKIAKHFKSEFKEWKKRQDVLFEKEKNISFQLKQGRPTYELRDISRKWYLISMTRPIEFQKSSSYLEVHSISLITLFDNMKVSIKLLDANGSAFVYFTGTFKFVGSSKTGLSINFDRKDSEQNGQIFIHLNREISTGFLKTAVSIEGYEWEYPYAISFEDYETHHSSELSLYSEVKFSGKGKNRHSYRRGLDVNVLGLTDEVFSLYTDFTDDQANK